MFTNLHGVTYQKTRIFMSVAVRISDLVLPTSSLCTLLERCQVEVTVVAACIDLLSMFWSFLCKVYVNELIVRRSICPTSCFPFGIDNCITTGCMGVWRYGSTCSQVGSRLEWAISVTRPLYCGERKRHNHWKGGWVGPNPSRRYRETVLPCWEKNSDSPDVHPVA